jgi:hypothetical protein
VLDSDSPMNRFSVTALARLHPIGARHKRNIPLELYPTACGAGWSRPDESVLDDTDTRSLKPAELEWSLAFQLLDALRDLFPGQDAFFRH